MQPARSIGVTRFGPFEVNFERREFRKHGVRIKLQTQPFQVLAALLEKPGETVTRDELCKRLWPNDTFVDFEHGLNAAVARLRHALGDSIEKPRYIETLSKLGYRFAATIKGDPGALSRRALEHERRRCAGEIGYGLIEMPRHVAPLPGPAERAQIARFTVGRTKELAEIEAGFRSLAEGRGLVVSVVGEAGIGKTTLLEVFAARLRARQTDCYIANGRCSERLAGSEAYLPLLEALESLVHDGGDVVSRLLKSVAPTWYLQIIPVSSVDASDLRMLADVRIASQERLKRELLTFFAEVSRLHPVVLLLEDVHWADASTVDVLSYLGSRIAGLRLLVVTTDRPSDLLLAKHPFLQARQELQAHGACREVALQFLNSFDIERYLALQFPGHSFPDSLASSVHACTEGNALFIVELLRYLRDRGVIAQANGQWALARPFPEVIFELPESVRSMIERKLDQLDEPARRLAAAAAVQGNEFDSAVLARALAMDPADVEERLERMERLHGLVRLVGEREFPDLTLTLRYTFVHVLYQNALECSLTATRKASLSGAVAEALIGFYEDRSAEIAPEAALLFHDARDFARASDYFLQAARNAARVHAYPEAVALCGAPSRMPKN